MFDLWYLVDDDEEFSHLLEFVTNFNIKTYIKNIVTKHPYCHKYFLPAIWMILKYRIVDYANYLDWKFRLVISIFRDNEMKFSIFLRSSTAAAFIPEKFLLSRTKNKSSDCIIMNNVLYKLKV